MAVISNKYVALISKKYMPVISNKYVAVISNKYVAVISNKYVAVISDGRRWGGGLRFDLFCNSKARLEIPNMEVTFCNIEVFWIYIVRFDPSAGVNSGGCVVVLLISSNTTQSFSPLHGLISRLPQVQEH